MVEPGPSSQSSGQQGPLNEGQQQTVPPLNTPVVSPQLSNNPPVNPCFGANVAELDMRSNYFSGGIWPRIIPTNQAVSLPAKATFNLYKPKPLSVDNGDFDIWLNRVQTNLRPHNLHFLIDSFVPRPTNRDPNAELWYHYTLLVRAWLGSCIEPDVVDKVVRRGHDTFFADDFMEELNANIEAQYRVTMARRAFDQGTRKNSFEVFRRKNW